MICGTVINDKNYRYNSCRQVREGQERGALHLRPPRQGQPGPPTPQLGPERVGDKFSEDRPLARYLYYRTDRQMD